MTKKQTQIVVVGLVLALTMGGLAYFFGVKPQLANAATYEAERENSEAITATLNARLVDLEAKQAEIGTAQAEYDALARSFPEDFEVSQWIGTVTAAANRSGVTLTELSPTVPALGTGEISETGQEAAVAPPPPSDVAGSAEAAEGAVPVDPNAVPAAPVGDVAYSTVNINATGSTGALRAFVAALASLDRPLLVDTMALADSAEGEPSLTIVGRTFLLRSLAAPTADQQPTG